MLILAVAEESLRTSSWWDRNASGFWVLVGVALTGVVGLVGDWIRRRHDDQRDIDRRQRDAYANVVSHALDFEMAYSLKNPRDDSVFGFLGLARSPLTGPDYDEIDVYIARRKEQTAVAVQSAIAIARAESDDDMSRRLDRLAFAVRYKRGGAVDAMEEWKRLGGAGTPAVAREVDDFTRAMMKSSER